MYGRSIAALLCAAIVAMCGKSEQAAERPSAVPTTLATDTPSTDSIATMVAANAPSARMTHVQDLDYLGTIDAASAARYAPYLTYGYAKADRLAIAQKAGIKTVFYTNPTMPICDGANEPCKAGDKAAYNYLNTGGTYNSTAAKTCEGTLIKGYYGTPERPAIYSDPFKSNIAHYYQAVFDDAINYLHYANGPSFRIDYLFIDNVQTNAYHANGTICGGWNNGQFGAAFAKAIAQTSDGPYIVNILGVNSISGINGKLPAMDAPNIAMGEAEGCYASNSPSNIVAGLKATFKWEPLEYGEIETIKRGKTYICYQNMTGDASRWTAQRIYAYASFLLSYDPNHAVYEQAFASKAGLRVYPEMQFVPMQPRTTAGAVSDYRQAGGLYYREFAACYNKGVAVGSCAIAVNPNSVAAPVPAGWGHQLTVSGLGVLDGGTSALTAPAPTSLPPLQAAILVR